MIEPPDNNSSRQRFVLASRQDRAV